MGILRSLRSFIGRWVLQGFLMALLEPWYKYVVYLLGTITGIAELNWIQVLLRFQGICFGWKPHHPLSGCLRGFRATDGLDGSRYCWRKDVCDRIRWRLLVDSRLRPRLWSLGWYLEYRRTVLLSIPWTLRSQIVSIQCYHFHAIVFEVLNEFSVLTGW